MSKLSKITIAEQIVLPNFGYGSKIMHLLFIFKKESTKNWLAIIVEKNRAVNDLI